jgi:hypothetical protein
VIIVQEENEMPRKNNSNSAAVGCVTALFILIMFAGLLSIFNHKPASQYASAASTIKTVPTPTPTKSPPIESTLRDIDVKKDALGIVHIYGTVTADKNYNYLQVELETYDANGNRIGTLLDNITNLKTGQTWRFDLMCYDDRTREPRNIKFTGW